MTLTVVLGAMALAAALLLAVPLFGRRNPPKARKAFDRAVFRDQLAEIDRDLERGVIGEANAAAARTEIERRLLRTEEGADADAPEADDSRPSGAPSRLARTVIVALVAAVPAAGGGVYAILGTPGLSDLPAAERAAAEATPQRLSDAELEDTVALIEKRLEARPTELQGWIILSTAYLRLGREDEAEQALERALALAADDPDRAARIAVNFGEALAAINGGQVVPRARAAFERAHALSPNNPSVRYYLGLERLQAGETRAALAIWQRLLADAPADAEWRKALREWVERIAAEQDIDLQELDGPAAPQGR